MTKEQITTELERKAKTGDAPTDSTNKAEYDAIVKRNKEEKHIMIIFLILK